MYPSSASAGGTNALQTFTVGGTAVRVLNANNARCGGLIANNGTVAAYVGPDASIVSGAAGATAHGGAYLAANGGALTLDGSYTGEWWAITAGSNAVISSVDYP